MNNLAVKGSFNPFASLIIIFTLIHTLYSVTYSVAGPVCSQLSAQKAGSNWFYPSIYYCTIINNKSLRIINFITKRTWSFLLHHIINSGLCVIKACCVSAVTFFPPLLNPIKAWPPLSARLHMFNNNNSVHIPTWQESCCTKITH